MPTIDEINTQKAAAVAILDDKIVAAIGLKNDGAARMDDVIHTLMVQRQAVFLAALDATLKSDELSAALAAIKAATADMNTVAAKMISATQFIGNVAALGTAANKVISALTGGG